MKAPDSGLRLGFSDIKEKEKVPAAEATPSKSAIAPDDFEFKFNRPDNSLSSEAQRIMESVREEAARIKEKMRAERDEQSRKEEEADQIGAIGNRDIAKAKGKSGRFSDAHKEEFKKMDSIATHGSVWKNKSAAEATLKRTQSKADLCDFSDSDRLENSSPGKRAKKAVNDDVSTARPISRDGPSTAIPLPRPLPSAVTTPTKASLARSQSVRNLKTSKLPTLNHSKSTKELVSPASKTDGANKYPVGLKKSVSMKSILQKPQLKFSNDPVKIAAGTHLPAPVTMTTATQSSVTCTPIRSPTKRVGFADELASASPSPTKVATAAQQTIKIPSPGKVSYPSLDKAGPLTSHPPAPGDFSFRAVKQISFAGPSHRVAPTTIRHVRPSGIPTALSPFEPLPAVPHGMPNKKRRRANDDEDECRSTEAQENRPPVKEETEGSPAKKARLGLGKMAPPPPTPGPGAASPMARRKLFRNRRPTGISPQKNTGGAEGKKGLSLSRLSFLARPKERG